MSNTMRIWRQQVNGEVSIIAAAIRGHPHELRGVEGGSVHRSKTTGHRCGNFTGKHYAGAVKK